MKGICLVLAVLAFYLVPVLVLSQNAQPKRLSCEEITGGLYIANAQLAEQLRETATKLAEAQAELAKQKDGR